jgi:hypothetical protein
MRRILKVLARLYPAAWRARYGAEYEALIEDAEPRARDGFDVFWGAVNMWVTSRSFVRVVLPCALAGALAGFAISHISPVTYTSGTIVMPMTSYDSASTPGVSDDAGQEPAGYDEARGLEVGEQERDLFTDREDLVRIILTYDLYPHERANMQMDDVVAKMRSAIFIRPVPRSSFEKELYDAKRVDHLSLQLAARKVHYAFAIQFVYPDPHIAQQVDCELVSALTKANLRTHEIAAAMGHPLPPEVTAVMDAATLPQKPDGLSWNERYGVGALAGLIGGMVVAIVTCGRRRPAVANG